MADRDNIIEEIFADSDSDGEDNFEGFDLEDLNTTELDDESIHANYNVLNSELWNEGDRTPLPLSFEQEPGLQKEVSDSDSPIEYFELFLDDFDYQNISDETNKYADQFLANKQLKEKSRFKKWRDTTALEMKKFFAIVIAMAIITQMDISEYWTVNPVTSTPFFPSVMSRDRFLLLLAFLHLNDNDKYNYSTWSRGP